MAAASRAIELGYATAIAARVSFVGELGYELLVPTEFTAGVYDTLVEVGRDLDLR